MKIKSKLSHRNFWIIALNSTSAFVLAYLLVFYLNHFTKVAMAAMFNIPVSFDWNQVYYYIEDFQWTHDMVTTIFSAGIFLVFIFGIISYGAFFALREEVTRLKIFFIWFTLLSFNFFFGNLLIGNIFTRGIGFVFQWAFFTDTTKVVIAMIGFFGLLLTAFVMRKPILFSANSYFSYVKEKNFPFFFTAQIIVPFFVGNLLSILYFYPHILFQERYSWMSLAVILLIVFMGIDDQESVLFDPEEKTPPISVSKVLVITAIAVYVVLRIILNSKHSFF